MLLVRRSICGCSEKTPDWWMREQQKQNLLDIVTLSIGTSGRTVTPSVFIVLLSLFMSQFWFHSNEKYFSTWAQFSALLKQNTPLFILFQTPVSSSVNFRRGHCFLKFSDVYEKWINLGNRFIPVWICLSFVNIVKRQKRTLGVGHILITASGEKNDPFPTLRQASSWFIVQPFQVHSPCKRIPYWSPFFKDLFYILQEIWLRMKNTRIVLCELRLVTCFNHLECVCVSGKNLLIKIFSNRNFLFQMKAEVDVSRCASYSIWSFKADVMVPVKVSRTF